MSYFLYNVLLIRWLVPRRCLKYTKFYKLYSNFTWDLKLFYGTLRYSSSILKFIYEPLTNNWDKASHSKGLLPCGSITLERTFLHKLLVGFGWDWEGKTSRGFLKINVKNIRATCNAFYVQNLNTLIN